MRKKPDPYASEKDTLALLRKDTRTPAERKLDRMLEDSGASEQGAEPFLILRQIALEMLAEQPAQQEPVAWASMLDDARIGIITWTKTIAKTWERDGHTIKELSFTSPKAQPQQEPVLGQSRFVGSSEWSWCSAEHVRMVLASPQEWKGYEARYLYTAPPKLAAHMKMD